MSSQLRPLVKNAINLGAILALAGLGVVSFYSFAMWSENPHPIPGLMAATPKMQAYAAAQVCIEDELESPSLATWPSGRDQWRHTNYFGKDTYRIRSYVFEPGVYSGFVRTEFTIVLERDGTRKNWSLLSLETRKSAASRRGCDWGRARTP